jgi:hypothetical protein
VKEIGRPAVLYTRIWNRSERKEAAEEGQKSVLIRGKYPRGAKTFDFKPETIPTGWRHGWTRLAYSEKSESQ